MSQLARFSYGGHSTFPVRYGWMPKGLGQLTVHSTFVANTDTADALGLGSKMVESLAYWLTMTGMSKDGKNSHGASAVADLITRYDPYFERPGTWWFLHLILAQQEGSVWSWFFNDYPDRIFDRVSATDAFVSYAKTHAQRAPSPAMAQRDLACLLSSYGTRPGVDLVDPEDIGACPFRELGLLIRHDAVNRYERARRPQGIPDEAFLAAASAVATTTGQQTLSLRELATVRMGPGRIFCQGLEAIELAVGKIGKTRDDQVEVETLAGERSLRVPEASVETWLEKFYLRVAGRPTQ
jgi:hypothetical protein